MHIHGHVIIVTAFRLFVFIKFRNLFLLCFDFQAKSWGELTRLYGTSVADKLKRKQDLEEEILELKEKKNKGRRPPQADDATSSKSKHSTAHENKDVLIANPELLAKLKSVMLSLGRKRGLLGDERKKREHERENEELQRKKRKLLLINV